MAESTSFGPYDDAAEPFEQYVERFEIYSIVNKISDENRKAVFLNCLGAKTYGLLRTLTAPIRPNDQTLTFAKVKDLLKGYLSPAPLEIAEAYRFQCRRQQPGESIRDFVSQLKAIAVNCNFGLFESSAIRNQLVYGLSCDATRRRLLCEAGLTLETAINIATAAEQSQKEVQFMSESRSDTGQHVDKLGYRDKHELQPCASCGARDHLRRNCRHLNSVCFLCSKVGHLQNVCRMKSKGAKPSTTRSSAPKAHAHSVEHREQRHGPSRSSTPTSSADETHRVEDDVEVIHAIGGRVPPAYFVTVGIEGHDVAMEFDTGSSVSTIPCNLYRKLLSHLPLQQTSAVLRPYGSVQTLQPMGIVWPSVRYGSTTARLRLFVIAEQDVPLLGREWISTLNLDLSCINSSHQMSVEDDVSALLCKYSELFSSSLGKFAGINAALHLMPGTVPVHQKHRTVPFAIREKCEKELAKLESDGVITKIEQSEWATPVVPVIKPDGSVRLCGDYKVTLNPYLIVDKYPMPSIDDLQEKMNGGTLFTKLDLSRAFAQIPLHDESRRYVTITTHKGLFAYNRLPFGVASAPAIHQRAMDQLLSGLDRVLCYQDDIFVTGTDRVSHLKNLEAVLQKLDAAGLRLRRDKCDFLQPSIVYLGHKIDKDGIHPTTDKVKAIKAAPAPRDVGELRSFLGLVQYYHKFLPDLATILHPLHKLLKKHHKWMWTAECDESFNKIKSMLSTDLVLTPYDANMQLVLACDASAYGLGAVLSHKFPDGQERPIAFASRSLSSSESNYSQIEREALSLIFGVVRFHVYLYGRKFTLQTDHKPLVTILGPKKGIPPIAAMRMQRWAAVLSAYSYDIEYKRSQDHANADAMSRLPQPCRVVDSEQMRLFHIEQFASLPVTFQKIRTQLQMEPALKKVYDATVKGWPVGHRRGAQSETYYKFRHELSTLDGCLLRGTRVVIPTSLREHILKELHDSHLGIVKMKATARNFVWWPKIDADIEALCGACPRCNAVRSAAPADPHPWTTPAGPWQRLHIDFAGPMDNYLFLIVVDAFTKWPEIFAMRNATSQTTIAALRTLFSRQGLPHVIVSDNGPQFRSADFTAFLQSNGIKHMLTAPYHPQSNGLAERFVQTFKRSYAASTGPMQTRIDKFLLKYRTTPTDGEQLTPAERLMGRKLRTLLDLIRPPPVFENEPTNQRENAAYSKGDLVWYRDYRASHDAWSPGSIVACRGHRMYAVQAGAEVTIRHADQLRKRTVMPYSQGVPGSTPRTDTAQQCSQHQSAVLAIPSVSSPSDLYVPTEGNVVSSETCATDGPHAQSTTEAAAQNARRSLRPTRGKPPSRFKDYA